MNVITTLNKKRIDIALITETHFPSNIKFSIPGYSIISLSHSDNTAHARVTMIIKFSLKFTPYPKINENYLQAAIVNIDLNHVPISIAATYCPVKNKISPTQYENF